MSNNTCDQPANIPGHNGRSYRFEFFITFLVVFLWIFSAGYANAQQKTLVTDKELLFTTEEISRIDSMLQDYHNRSGNLIVVCTDTLDVSMKSYKDSLVELYTGDKPVKPYAVFLLLSRKNSEIRLESNDLLTERRGKQGTVETASMSEDAKKGLEEFMKIVTYGLPAIKEKKREEGVTIICRKAMEFMDRLPKKDLTNN